MSPQYILAHDVGKDAMPSILGFAPGFGIPLSGQCTVQEAIDDVLEEYRGDALINVTVDVYWHSWILFSICTTRVEGDVIRFKRPSGAEMMRHHGRGDSVIYNVK